MDQAHLPVLILVIVIIFRHSPMIHEMLGNSSKVIYKKGMNTFLKILIVVVIIAASWIYFDAQDTTLDIPRFEHRLGKGPEKISLSEKEWKERLTPEQYYILREKGTEPAYSGDLHDKKEAGTYVCAACALPLFSSKDKYDSRTGWPSFTKPIDPLHIIYNEDTTLWIKRTEVSCARCDSHLGHVFEDGPPPTGLRYCINSLALIYEQETNVLPHGRPVQMNRSLQNDDPLQE